MLYPKGSGGGVGDESGKPALTPTPLPRAGEGPWRRECLGLLERHLRQCCQVRRDRPGLQRLLDDAGHAALRVARSEEHTSELQSLMRNSYAVFCLKKKKTRNSAYDS